MPIQRQHLALRPLIVGTLTAIGMLLGLASIAAPAHGAIYWSTSKLDVGPVIGVAEDNGTVVDTELVKPGGINVAGLASNANHLFFLKSLPPVAPNPPKTLISRVGLNGSDETLIYEPADRQIESFALSGSQIFFSNSSGPPFPNASIGRVGIGGENPNLNFLTEPDLGTQPGSIAIRDDLIYFSAPPDENRIGRIGTDGSGLVGNLIPGPRNLITSLTVTENRIFWIDFTYGNADSQTEIQVADIDGSNPRSIDTGSTGVLAVAADSEYVYWGTNQGKIGRARHDGTDRNTDFITDVAEAPRVIFSLAVGDGSPPPPPPAKKARLGKVTVSGPGKVKRGKTATWNVKIPNVGNATATGVRVAAVGRGIRLTTRFSNIAAGKSRTERIKARLRKVGKFTATFKVTTKNAGTKTVKKTVRVTK